MGGEGFRQAVEIATDIARRSRSAQGTLSAIYEDLLGHQADLRPATGRCYLRTERGERKLRGAFYTPTPVARMVVEAALEPLEKRALPRVLDPAMGAGAFLLETVRYLIDRWRADAHLKIPRGRTIEAILAERCLYGVDSDPIAVELAVLSLYLETGAHPAILARHLRCGDLLSAQTIPHACRYDAVIGNPPWGAVYTAEKRQWLKRRFPRSTQRSFDSFKLFLDLACRLSRGTVSMIVPQAVLGQATHADVRALLLEHLDPYFAAKLPSAVFPGTAAPACALMFGPKPGPSDVMCVETAGEGSFALGARGHRRIPSSHWTADRGFPLRGHNMLGLLQRLQERHTVLGRVAHLYRVRDVGINYSRAAIARRILYTGPDQASSLDVPRYRGRDFARYTSIDVSGWIRHDASDLLEPGETIFLDWQTYALPEKVVLRQTADRVIATLDRSRMAMGRSVIAITREASVSLRALLACLNSRLMTALYRSVAGEEGRVLPQVKVARIRALPIPRMCSAPWEEVAGREEGVDQELLSGQEDALLERTQANPGFGWTCLDRLAELLLQAQGESARLNALVDQVVYRLYGLSPQEIELVEAG